MNSKWSPDQVIKTLFQAKLKGGMGQGCHKSHSFCFLPSDSDDYSDLDDYIDLDNDGDSDISADLEDIFGGVVCVHIFFNVVLIHLII